MNTDKIIIILLSFCLLLLVYISFYVTTFEKMKLSQCFDMAVNFEKARHGSSDDLTVTNQDISSFQKNMIACLAI